MRVVVEEGVELEVEVRGAGPALICVHGFGGAKEDFADHVDALAARATVVLVDLRGHGASDGPDDTAAYTLDRCAADVLAVADALGFDRFGLLGHSMGGMVVRRVALGAPGRVAGVVFVSTAAGPPKGLDPALVDLGAQLALEDFAALKAVLDEAKALGTPAYERLMAERAGFAEYAEWKWSRLNPAMWAALGPEIVRERDATGDLRDLACPALVMVGELDAAFYDASLALVAAVPAGRLSIIPDAGHHPQFENPDVWLAELATFLDDLAGTPEVSP